MIRQALVTGGAGFIGSHLVDELISGGAYVTVLDDLSSGARENLTEATASGRLRVVEGSVLSADDIQGALDGCDTVFHLAVKSVRHSIGNPLENHAVNAGGSLNVLEAARRAGVARFIYCSSSEVYGNAPRMTMREDTTVCLPVTVYGGSKLAGEYYTAAYHQTYGLPVAVVRPFNAYGPRAHVHGASGEVIPRFAARLLNGLPPVIFGDGSQSRDFTFVTDVARGLRLAAEKEAMGLTINVAYGHNVSVLAIARAVALACDRADIGPIFQSPRPGDVRALRADVSRCREVLGFKPGVRLSEGLARYVSWLRRTAPDPAVLREDNQLNWSLPS